MIVAADFVWAHLPKAGGDATAAMFAAVPGLIRFADPPESNAKHAAFWEREDRVGERLRVMNIRRLPAWILSAAHHKASAGLYPDYLPLTLPTAEEMVETTDPDDLLRWMTDGPRYAVEHWMRAETLHQDLLALFERFGALDAAARAAIGEVPWRGRPYERDLRRRFTAVQVRRLYELNPGWAEIERRQYGDLIEL